MLKTILRGTFSRFTIGYIFGPLVVAVCYGLYLEFWVTVLVAVIIGLVGSYLARLLPE